MSEDGVTMVPWSLILDTRISPTARMAASILCNPEVQSPDVLRVSLGVGRKAYATALAELRTAGYAVPAWAGAA